VTNAALAPAHDTAATRPLELVRTSLGGPEWRDLVAADSAALPFHHPAWASLLADCYGYRSFGLGLRESGERRLLAGLPIVETALPVRKPRWISLPFSDVCPPLLADGAPRELLVRLEDEADALRRNVGVASLEVRSAPAGHRAATTVDAVLHTLQLERDPDAVFKRFKPKQVRHPIRVAERKGVTVRRAEREADLTETFYDLHVATRRRLGVPVQPRRYFRLLWQRIVEPGLGFVLIATVDGAPIAASVFLTWNGTVSYKYSASDNRAWALRPNNAVLWHAIRWGCETGCRAFDFGRSDLDNEGLRSFKSHWGGDETPLAYAYFGVEPSRAGAAGRTRSLAATVIRRSPPFVCRAAGRALYRYAA
jgi:CelD/BcsL family acetyltransferase involved in cellulose biosynthesis